MIKRFLVLILSLAFAHSTSAEIDFDSTGQSRAIVQWPATVAFSSSVWIVRDNWKSIVQQTELQDVRRSGNSISGVFAIEKSSIDFEQSMRETAKATRIDYELHSRSKVSFDAIHWFGAINTDQFAGGTVTIGRQRIDLPKEKRSKVLMNASSDRIEIRDQSGELSIEIKFDRQLAIAVQDAREFGSNTFQLYVPIVENELRPGARARLGVSISATTPQDNLPARVEVNADQIVSSFDGFGGNFVYQIDSPVTDYNLRTLKLTWSRLGMDLTEWEPANDNASPAEPLENWGKTIDTPTSGVRRRFELDQRIYEASGERTIISVWRLPEWIYDQPIQLPPGQLRDVGGTVKPEMWPELIECITTYLSHLKDQYAVEPGYFSFNEPDYGIYLLLTGEELNLLYQQLGSAFESAGLKTRLLLPDSATLNKGMELMQPALKDPDTMRYVGALAYHAWSGEQSLWDSWAQVAQEHKLPLLVTEAGLDANAWRDNSYNTPINALRLAERYVNLIVSSRAQAILEWEWTGDYSLCHVDNGRFRPSSRYWLMWQLTNNTSAFGRVASTTSNKNSVKSAMVLSGENDEPAFSLHISNTGQRRRITVAGLPAIARKITVIMTEFLSDRPPSITRIDFPRYDLELEVPAGAIVTVTTLPVADPKR